MTEKDLCSCSQKFLAPNLKLADDIECRLYSYGEDAEGSHGKDDDVGSVCQQLNVPEKRFSNIYGLE
jgi:hypothetical protein